MEDYKQKITKFAPLPHISFLILFIASGIVSIGALRHNNTTMIDLRNQVYAADKNNGDVNAALNKLRAYVYSHMNTNLSTSNGIKPPIQLSYTYARLQEKQSQNSDLYVEAKNYCEQKIPANVSVSGQARVNCIIDYVNERGAKPANIPVGLYQFDFLSPRWSPDLAGWSLLTTILFFVGFIVTFILNKVFRKRINL